MVLEVTNELIRQIEIEYRTKKNLWGIRIKYISIRDILKLMKERDIGFICTTCWSRKFPSTYFDNTARYCCKEHSRYYRLIARRFDWNSIKEDLFNEREWICGICGQEIERKSLSLDHITSIRDGGLEFDYDNLQLAHIECNLKKKPVKKLINGQNRINRKLDEFINL